MTGLETVQTHKAPEPVGPYSQAIVTGTLVFTSGQIGLDESGILVGGDVLAQATQVFKNLAAILEAAGAQVSSIVKVTLYLTNIQDFKAINELYASWIGEPSPARTTIGVSELPLGALVEAECIAKISS